MISNIVVVILTIIGLETVICWTLRFCFWVIEKMMKGKQK